MIQKTKLIEIISTEANLVWLWKVILLQLFTNLVPIILNNCVSRTIPKETTFILPMKEEQSTRYQNISIEQTETTQKRENEKREI